MTLVTRGASDRTLFLTNQVRGCGPFAIKEGSRNDLQSMWTDGKKVVSKFYELLKHNQMKKKQTFSSSRKHFSSLEEARHQAQMAEVGGYIQFCRVSLYYDDDIMICRFMAIYDIVLKRIYHGVLCIYL